MENSRPFTFPQNFQGGGQENPEREDGDSVNLTVSSPNVNVIKEEDSVRTEKEDGPVSAAQEDEDVSAKVKFEVGEKTVKINGDVNLTINCSDLRVNTENEKSEIESRAKPYSVIWISAPTKENAVDVATLLLTEKLVSSVNILDGVTTMNMKDGKIETITEVVVKMKTETSLVPEIIKVTDDHFKNKLSIHDAEILSTTLKDGNLAYFRYVSENTKDASPPRAHIREEQDDNLVQHSKQLELMEQVIQKNVEVSGQFELESHT